VFAKKSKLVYNYNDRKNKSSPVTIKSEAELLVTHTSLILQKKGCFIQTRLNTA